MLWAYSDLEKSAAFCPFFRRKGDCVLGKLKSLKILGKFRAMGKGMRIFAWCCLSADVMGHIMFKATSPIFRKLLACCLIFTAQSHVSQAATALVPVAQDATLFEDINGALAGGASSLYVGRVGTRDATPLRRALLQFDLSSLPTASGIVTITGVRLAMTVISSSQATESSVSLHRVTASWREGTALTIGGQGGTRTGADATWVHRDAVNQWSMSGGDFLGVGAAAEIVGGPGLYEWTSSAMINDVQGWIDNPDTNFGWLMRGDESTPQSVKVLASKESSSGRPVLEVTYDFTPVPEPSATLLVLFGSLALVGARGVRLQLLKLLSVLL